VGESAPVTTPAPAAPPEAAGVRRPRPPLLVVVPAVLVAAAILIPLAYLIIRAVEGGTDTLGVLTRPATATLIWRTFGLAAAVTTATILLGVPLAYLTSRTDLPGRRAFTVLTAVPLVIPSYVGAFALIAALGPGGLVEGWLAPLGLTRLPEIYGFLGAFLALTLFTYPYVLLTVQGTLRGLDPSTEEASRSLGTGAFRTFLRVTLPQLRPSIGAGGLLVALYVLSDFGAVSLMRFSTFTRVIYIQYRSAFDRSSAAMLALLLVVFTAVILIGEMRLARAPRETLRRAHGTAARKPPLVPLGRWRWPAAVFCGGVVTAALVIPMTTIAYWLVRGLRVGETLTLTVGTAWNSLLASALGAVAVVLCALPIAILAARYRSRLGVVLERTAYAGYALPGIVVALALVFFGARVGSPLYQSLGMLVFAYVVLFLPQSVGTIRASLLQISPSVEEAARSLGSGPLEAIWRVIIPVARRGALAGGALVFLTCMKELPATLLLAPTGYRTLATVIWGATSEAFFARAAAPALALVLLGSLPLAFLVVRQRDLAH
jgi:iron(III) transport system permease protein